MTLEAEDVFSKSGHFAPVGCLYSVPFDVPDTEKKVHYLSAKGMALLRLMIT